MKISASIFTLLLLVFFAASQGCTLNRSNTSNTNSVTNAASNAEAAPPLEPSAAGAMSPAAAAEALVADLYKQHDGKKSPFFQTKNRALVDKYFTKPIADLIWKDANNSSGEVGAIDGDPLYNAQDMEIKNFAIGKAEVKGETATLPVTFTNYGDKQTITFALRRVNDAWKIDDIKYSAGDSLLKWLKNTYNTKPGTSVSGEFEGKFQVGDTTCTVKPVKMAFEVRWAKGSGVETFFFKDGYTFESDGKDGTNRFEFDDENYATGTFYRADGKTFPVKRAR